MSKASADYERCKACGLCIAYCKKDALEMTDEINSRGYKIGRASCRERV